MRYPTPNMSNRLYLGNLPFSATEVEIRESFSQVGAVQSVRIVTDRVSGRSKGFAFVDMNDETTALAAVERFNGADYAGKVMTVSIAKSTTGERPARAPRNPRNRPPRQPAPARNPDLKLPTPKVTPVDAQSSPKAEGESKTSEQSAQG